MKNYSGEKFIFLSITCILFLLPSRVDGQQISGIHLSNAPVDWEGNAPPNSTIGLPRDLTLKYNQNDITFNIALPDVGASATEYRFKLDSFDKNWLPLNGEKYVRYTNVAPGDYTFIIGSFQGNGTLDKVESSFHFVIVPPLWLRWWFIVICLTPVIFLTNHLIKKWVEKIKQEEQKKIEFSRQLVEYKLIALRAQMNPHFIFNVLNTIQYFIHNNDKYSAYDCLSKFSKLIRLMLDKSNQTWVRLDDEIKILNFYVEIELLRFQNKFQYLMDVDPDLDPKHVKISSFLIQPYVENAIIHGLMNRKDNGKIKIQIKKCAGGNLHCTIEDNGVGRAKAEEVKNKKDILYKSFGMSITENRLNLINEDVKGFLVTDLYDKDDKPAGTRVEIIVPYTIKQSN
jgi:hypothetical protein